MYGYLRPISDLDYTIPIYDEIRRRQEAGYRSAVGYHPMIWEALLNLEMSLSEYGYKMVWLFEQSNSPHPVKVYIEW